jgi:uncharacterized protein with GYD domain
MRQIILGRFEVAALEPKDAGPMFERAKEWAVNNDVTVEKISLVIGDFDLVALIESDSPEKLLGFIIALSGTAKCRTTTLIVVDDMEGVLEAAQDAQSKLGGGHG